MQCLENLRHVDVGPWGLEVGPLGGGGGGGDHIYIYTGLGGEHPFTRKLLPTSHWSVSTSRSSEARGGNSQRAGGDHVFRVSGLGLRVWGLGFRV